MIRHVVVWKLSATDLAQKAVDAQSIADVLLPLRSVIPEIRALAVGPNVAYFDANWDVAIIADFDDVAGLEVYQRHPRHQEAAAVVRSLVSDRASIDLEV